jgi:hypothetical protein
MFLAVATVGAELTREEALQLLSSLGWSFALGLSLIIWWMLERVERDDEKRAKSSGQTADRERLFGREVVAGEPDTAEASEDAASGAEVGDAGLADEERPV